MPNPIKELPFPWPCGKCGEQAVERETLPYSTVVQYDGRAYTVDLPEFRVPRCKNCGAMVFDDSANDQITDALRRQVGLLPPERIRSNRESLGLTQRDFAGLLGVGESTVSRWETGVQIQQKSLDRLMRLFFAFPEVRESLIGADRLADLGTQVVKEQEPRPAAQERPDPAALFRGGVEQATPWAELASRLDALTEAKRQSALVEFQRLAELMIN
jgi:putative zinc finger/helix-turn-helix YgiT family protein